MTDAYASVDDLTAWLPASVSVDPDDAPRLLKRASDLIDSTVRAGYTVDDNGIPTIAALAQALNDACCAVVESWVEVGEANDIDGLAGTAVQVAGKSGYVGFRAPELCPRAFRILQLAGLLSLSVEHPSPAFAFFDDGVGSVEILP